MESFLPFFQDRIEALKPFLEQHNFVFESVRDQTNIDKLTSKTFYESLDAVFIKNDETICISCSYSKSGKLSLDCSYHNKSKRISFFLEYYAGDHNIQQFGNNPVIQSHNEGKHYISKYLVDLKTLLETTLMPKINNGTIDNHYYRFHDQFR